MKIAFLFLIVSQVYHETYWMDFFSDNSNRYTIYVHSKYPMPKQSFFKQYEIPIKVATSWSRTMRAQIELLREALKDPENEKFIFVSESTIPLQDFDTIYTTVMKTNKSFIRHESNAHLNPSYIEYGKGRILKPIPPHLQYKNPQWIILNRKHAQLMIDDKKYLDIITNYASDQEHYPSTFLATQGLLHEVINKETTYVDWKKPSHNNRLPYVFVDLQDTYERESMMQAIVENKFLFARKFGINCLLKPLDQFLSYRIAQYAKPLLTEYNNQLLTKCMDKLHSQILP